MTRRRTCAHDLLDDVESAVNDGPGEAASAGSGGGVAADNPRCAAPRWRSTLPGRMQSCSDTAVWMLVESWRVNSLTEHGCGRTSVAPGGTVPCPRW